MTIYERQTRIAVAGGWFPKWLYKRKDREWLDELYRLVSARVIVLGESGPEISPTASTGDLMNDADSLAWLLST